MYRHDRKGVGAISIIFEKAIHCLISDSGGANNL